MRKVVVTGASGFVGRQALAPLIDLGFEVHGLCRTPPDVQGVIWHSHDLLEQPTDGLMAAIRPTHLLHCAWVTEHGQYWASPDNARWIIASQRLFEAFAAAGGTDIVALGTCAEYDWNRSDATPWRERDPCLPATPYGQAKLDLFHWLATFAATHGLRHAWARLFFLFGPGEDSRRLVPYLVECAKTGVVARCTSGLQVRDFLDTAHCGAWLADLVSSNLSGPVNMASGHAITLRQLAETVNLASGGRLRCDFGAIPDRPSDPPYIVADVSKLASVRRTMPEFDLTDSMKTLF